MSRKILTIRSGVQFMKNAAKKKDFLHTLIIPRQWAYRKKFEDAGLTALLGCGFDPGVTQAYCAYALKHEFDQIDTIDILWTATAVIMDTHLRQTLTLRSIFVK